MSQENTIRVRGIVREVFRGSRFKVELCNDEGTPLGHEISATVSGKLRMHCIKILKGDKVQIDLPVCDLNNGRIVWRDK